MARQTSWRRVEDGLWRTPVTLPEWRRTNYGIVFEVKAGIVSNFKRTNAIINILKPIQGKRGQYELLRSKSFDNSWIAKEIVDALLLLARSQSNDDNKESSIQLLLNIFDQLTGAPEPEQPELNELPTHIYSYKR